MIKLRAIYRLKLLLYVSQRENSITEKECNVMEYKFSNRALSAKPSRIREISARGAIDPEFISFAIGNPAYETFPVEEIRCNDLISERCPSMPCSMAPPSVTTVSAS